MTLPTTIEIGGRIIQILVDDHLVDWGEYDHDAGIIKLSRKAAEGPEAVPTLRHEMVHASMHMGGVAYNEGMEEEAVVRCMDSIFWPAWGKAMSIISKHETQD